MKIFAFIFVIFAFVATSQAVKDPVCNLKHSVDGANGIACAAYKPSWSYNSAANECVKFIYGGCGGNENRFSSKEACETKCKE